jgi:hypothetical protein
MMSIFFANSKVDLLKNVYGDIYYGQLNDL